MPKHKITIVINDPDDKVGKSIGNDPMRAIDQALIECDFADYEWNIEFNADVSTLS